MTDELCMILINKAKEIANKNFCCSHSKFTVGAALLTDDNKLYLGFNVENDGIMSICAERSAFIKALTSEKRNFKAIAIVGRSINENLFKETLPCGYCRQFMSEYVNSDFLIITYDDETQKISKYLLNQLLPNSFITKKDI